MSGNIWAEMFFNVVLSLQGVKRVSVEDRGASVRKAVELLFLIIADC
jgi:hypothetical protein